VDDANSARVARDIDLAKGLGEILVKIYRVKIIPLAAAGNTTQQQDAKSVTEISEKALKGQAISHGTG
jgi:hypothetical protein